MIESLATPAFSFVHAADLHLDTPFKGIGQTAPAVAEQLREASLDAFDALVDLCLERDAAFLVVAGDVYDGPERGLRAQLRFRDGLARLADAGISSFVVHGNHDPVATGWSAIGSSWPELVTVFDHEQVGAVTVERSGVPIATVQGISYGQQRESRNLAVRFRPSAGPGLSVGVLHCNVQGAASGYEDYSPCTLDDLRKVGLDYWALGHVHTQMVLSGTVGTDDPWVVYPGNLQARSPKPSERGPKGAVVVQVEAGQVTGVEPVACDRVRFDLVELDVAPAGDLAELRSMLAATARERVLAADERSLVLRARLVGNSDLARDLRRPGTVDDLLVSLRQDFSELRPFCWWDAVDDASSSALDLEAVAAGADFAADLVKLARELRSTLSGAGPAVDAFAAELSEGLPSAARVGGLDRLFASGEDSPAGLVDRAVTIALVELQRDGD